MTANHVSKARLETLLDAARCLALCLVEPGDCLLGYPEDASPFLDQRYLQPVRRGYVFTFHPGRAAPPNLGRIPGVSASLIDRWAYVAVPSPPLRGAGFCRDARQIICSTLDGQTPRIDGGLCVIEDAGASGCEVLERRAR